MTSISRSAVVVIAASAEGLDALIRLMHQLPARLPALIVGTVHGMDDMQLQMLVRGRLASVGASCVPAAAEDMLLVPGQILLLPASRGWGFTAWGTLGMSSEVNSKNPETGADRLFESASRIHGSSVIGVILSGRGRDGTRGMLAITEAGGIRIVQTPCEATHFGMPFHALMHDHINHSVVLDDMGQLICKLVQAPVR
jgi:two-component system chemotaxis response regulator CheB